MYRGCCIEWDCLMMHRIKSVAFSWAPLSLSYTPLSPSSPPTPASLSLVFTHSQTPTPFPLSLASLSPPSPFNPMPPPRSPPLSPFHTNLSVLDRWPHVPPCSAAELHQSPGEREKRGRGEGERERERRGRGEREERERRSVWKGHKE